VRRGAIFAPLLNLFDRSLEAVGEHYSRSIDRVLSRPLVVVAVAIILFIGSLGLGEGAELRTPMALTVIGGMITSTLLTLLVVPAVYAILDRKP